jgi:hypothetical protein
MEAVSTHESQLHANARTFCVSGAGGSTEQSTDTIQAATDGAESVYGTCRVGRSFQYAFTTADGLEPGALRPLHPSRGTCQSINPKNSGQQESLGIACDE